MTKELSTLLCIFLLSINIIAFTTMGYDKYASKHIPRHRVRERTLLLIATIGGSIGMILAMKIFKHKTLHKKFYIGVPIIFAIQVIIGILVIIELIGN